MIVYNATDFRKAIASNSFQAEFAATARAAFLIEPKHFALSAQSARDNVYMQMQTEVNSQRALQQHHALAKALQGSVPIHVFNGIVGQPDGIFPNNAFAVANKKLILGMMKHPVRQVEIEHPQVRQFFQQQNYALDDLSRFGDVAELTGALVIDRARGIGFAGLSERCSAEGAARMHDAFGLKLTYCFPLHPSEYHTNVVLSILAGRAAVIAPDGFAEREDAAVIAEFYQPHSIEISLAEKNAFAANCIALDPSRVWMSAVAEKNLTAKTREAIESAGFAIHAVELDEIEKAGGSLRCCVAEVF